jgi:uncharacterized membrane protein (DUF4010 family)
MPKKIKPSGNILFNWFIAASLVVAMFLVPDNVLEPWLGIDLKKILKIILSLAAIQAMGLVLLKHLNSHAGIVIHGFISGIISSTAFTVALAKKSTSMTKSQKSVESLGFLSATLAMLSQGIFLALLTAKQLPWSSLSLFVIPMVVTILLMIRRSIHTSKMSLPKESNAFSWWSILKLGLFIVIILSISHQAKKFAGDLGMQVVTFIVSLFEAHGSIIASSQILYNKKIDLPHFETLIFLAILSSYVSKLIIVFLMGDKYLKRKITIWSGAIVSSLALAYYLI